MIDLHLTVPSMNRLNQVDPATFSILPFCAFIRGSYFLYINFHIVGVKYFSHSKLYEEPVYFIWNTSLIISTMTEKAERLRQSDLREYTGKSRCFFVLDGDWLRL
jgi:hypothetical protein